MFMKKKKWISTIATLVFLGMLLNLLSTKAYAVDLPVSSVNVTGTISDVQVGDSISAYSPVISGSGGGTLYRLESYVIKDGERVSTGNFESGHDYKIVVTFKVSTDNQYFKNPLITLTDGWSEFSRAADSKSISVCHTITVLGSSAPTPENNTPSHTHEWVEGVLYAATQDSDGLEGIYCKTCGAIKESHPISAYSYSLNDYASPMINAAKAGQTITFEFGEWNSFPKSFMEKISAKSAQGVTFVFHYKWNHQKQEITIPAGTPVDLNFDWYGPAKMAELYGAN